MCKSAKYFSQHQEGARECSQLCVYRCLIKMSYRPTKNSAKTYIFEVSPQLYKLFNSLSATIFATINSAFRGILLQIRGILTHCKTAQNPRKSLFINGLRGFTNGRDYRIRTCDLFTPSEARYQAAPSPDICIFTQKM